MTETMDIDAYFERIGYQGPREATADALRQLHRAHMLTVPFENLDIHLGHPILLSLPAFYDKIIRRRRGGFCYELNGLFGWLLEFLGFSVKIVSARVLKGTQQGPEFDHLVLLVKMEATFVVDVGFGDSFLEPIRLDAAGRSIQCGDAFRVEEGSDSEWVLHRRREREWEPQYVFSLVPRGLSDFSAMCRHHQIARTSPFTQKTVCSLATPAGRITVSNNRLITADGERREEREISDQEEYLRILKSHFGIELGEGENADTLMKPALSRKSPFKHLRVSDIRGAAQMATQATAGVTRMAEGVHRSVLDTLGVPGGREPGLTRGITGLVYKSVHDGALLLGKGVDEVLAMLQPIVESIDHAKAETPERERTIAALNGVMGDRLAAGRSPFATPMTLRYRGEPLNREALSSMPHAAGKVVLLIHGLCMNDLQWRVEGEGHGFDHGEALQMALGYTPVYLRYNSGLHTSENGRELSARIEDLVVHWPEPIEELTVVAHSMGGLLIRSAFHYGTQEASFWPAQLKNIVFLGTPHHGAPLERAGNWVDVVLGSTRYSAPFAKLGQLRSAGITDLRFGHVLDEDWQGSCRFRRKPDNRQVVPLPEGVACFTVAATTAARRSPLAERLIGDGLVPLDSALGRHKEARRNLVFDEAGQLIVFQTNHLGLLGHPDVSRQMIEWLGGKDGG